MTNPDNVGGLPGYVSFDELFSVACKAWDEHQAACRVTTAAGSMEKAIKAVHERVCAELCRAAPAGGDYRGTIPKALDETINGVVSDLEMIAAGKDQVTGDPVSELESQRIAKSAHDRLLSAWNACTPTWCGNCDGRGEVQTGECVSEDDYGKRTCPECNGSGLDSAPAGSGEVEALLMEFACKAEALAERWRDDAKGFRERDMIHAADDAEFYAEELGAILPREEGGAAGGIYGPLSGEKEASMRGYCMTQLATVEDEYPDSGKFIRDWLTHVENERNRLFAALLRKLQQGADTKPKAGIPFEVLDRVPGQPADEVWLMQDGECLGKFKVAASQDQEGE